MSKITIGGERLGAGKRMKAEMHNYERSTHNLSKVWRSTMACGTIVPCLSLVALPGDTFDMDIDMSVLTHPTVGPLFGSYKAEVHVFQIPIRLYNAKLHMNMLGIGMNMADIKFPQVRLQGNLLNEDEDLAGQHINPSCVMKYLGVSGLGAQDGTGDLDSLTRDFNALALDRDWETFIFI